MNLKHSLKYTFLVSLMVSHFVVTLNAGPNKTSIFDTPTALSLDKAEYIVDTFFYNKGGVLAKVGVGINQYFNLGVLEYSDGLIGYGENRWSIPGVSAKIRFTDSDVGGHNVAIGFDSFFNGSFSSSPNDDIYGVYAVYSKGFMLGDSFDDASLFSVGVRYPLIYEMGQPNIFASLYFSFFKVFDFAIEIENLHFVKQYEYYFIFNNMLILQLVEELSIEMVFQLALEETSNSNEKPELYFARGLRISFSSTF